METVRIINWIFFGVTLVVLVGTIILLAQRGKSLETRFRQTSRLVAVGAGVCLCIAAVMFYSWAWESANSAPQVGTAGYWYGRSALIAIGVILTASAADWLWKRLESSKVVSISAYARGKTG